MFRPTLSQSLTVILLCLIAIAPIRAMFAVAPPGSTADAVGEHRRVEGNVVDIDGARLVLDVVEVDDTAYTGRVRVSAPLFPQRQIGDRVSVMCDLERPEPFDGFPYDRYLAIRNVYALCRTGDIPLLIRANADIRVTTRLAQLRMALMHRIDRVMPEPEATLLAGLLLGDADFSEAWNERFSLTGTSHIVAASGTNVTMVVFVLFGFLVWCGVRRQYAVPVLLGGIAAYAVMAGLEPAVVRAAIMGGVLAVGQGIGRKTTMRNVFLLAVALMVTIEPLLITSDVGFGLSVLSTASLIWLAPVLQRWLQWIPAVLGLREAFVGSLASSILTLPLVILAFGRVAVVGPFVNLLALPFVPYAMVAGIVGIIGGNVVALPAWGLLRTLLEIIRTVASLL